MAGRQPRVWGKNLTFDKIFAEKCTKMKENNPREVARVPIPPGSAMLWEIKLVAVPVVVSLVWLGQELSGDIVKLVAYLPTGVSLVWVSTEGVDVHPFKRFHEVQACMDVCRSERKMK